MANSVDSTVKFLSFTSLDHLRATWEIWAICYDSVLGASKNTEFFAALIRPLLTQMTFIGYEGAVNFKHFEVRFVSLMADNIMSNMGALVNSTTPYDEGWLRARWFDELKSICIWPVNIRQRASDWEREHSKGLRSPAISPHPTQTPAPNGKRAKISQTGSGLSKSAANNHPSPQSNPSPRATRTSSPAVAQEICRNELYHQLNITSKGCSTANCNRNHFELTKLAKPTLVAACEAPPLYPTLTSRTKFLQQSVRYHLNWSFFPSHVMLSLHPSS